MPIEDVLQQLAKRGWSRPPGSQSPGPDSHSEIAQGPSASSSPSQFEASPSVASHYSRDSAPHQVELELQPNPSEAWKNRENDPYWSSGIGAQQRLSKLGWELGIREWLAKSDPQLHDDIYRRLPELIDSFWGQASLAEFRALLNNWVEAHQEALKLYRNGRELRTK